MPKQQRIIAHMDMDAFFASVEARDNPKIANLAIVVGSDPRQGKGRGVVSTANYQAREYGIHSGQPISIAWRLSQKAKEQGKPETVFILPDIGYVSKVSDKIMDIVKKFSPLIEQASIDEAYFDLSKSRTYEAARKKAIKIKQAIKDQQRLTCSIGIGPNKLIAKIAAGKQKPNGLTVITPKEVQNFLDPLSVRDLPGIGPKTQESLEKFQIFTIKDLRQKFTLSQMEEKFGKHGIDMYYKSRGIDDSPLEEERESKSIGEQETFEKDTRDFNFIGERLNVLCEGVFKSVKHEGFKRFSNIVLTVRFANFTTRDRSITLSEPCDNLKDLQFHALKLLLPFFDNRENPQHWPIRLIGVRARKFE